MSIYQCSHIFLVYQGGGGGNWVSRVISNIKEGQLEKISLSPSGSSHTKVDLKRRGEDHISFGTVPQSIKVQHHSQIRYDQCLAKISSMEVKELVVWSHDFSNIPLYRKYFVRSRVLAIIAQNLEAKLSHLFMRINKINFDIQSIRPYSSDQDRAVALIFTLMIKQGLIDQGFTDHQSQEIIRSGNFNLLLYAALWSYLSYYGLLGYLESGHEISDRFDRVLYPCQSSIDFVNRYINCDIIQIKLDQNSSINQSWSRLIEVGELNFSYLDHQVVKMDYNIFVNRSVDQFVEVIGSILDRKLTDKEEQYLIDQFQYYLDHQDNLILTNPRQYYQNIKKKFLKIKESL